MLLGTTAVLAAFGYSINSLTLLGVVLAIGLLVDDAIVSWWRTSSASWRRSISRRKRRPSGRWSGSTGALVGIALVLSAVFVPMAFFGGSGGVIYPAVLHHDSLLDDPVGAGGPGFSRPPSPPRSSERRRRARRSGAASSAGSTPGSRAARRVYAQQVSRITRRPARALLALLIVAGLAALGYLRLPGGYLPEEDQGFMFVQVTAPPGATDSHVLGVLDDVTRYFLTEEKQADEGNIVE